MQGPARRGQRGMHSPQGAHNPLRFSRALLPSSFACKERGKKTVLFPLAEEAAILCKGPPGEGVGECTARRASTIPWLQPGKKTVLFPLAEKAAILCKSPPGEGNGDVGAERRNPLLARQAGYWGIHSPQGEHNPPCG